jgi:hypothetical protein
MLGGNQLKRSVKVWPSVAALEIVRKLRISGQVAMEVLADVGMSEVVRPQIR